MEVTTCPSCGKENAPNGRFCVSCGASLAERPPSVCTQCAAEVGEKDNYCPVCGAGLKKERANFKQIPKSAPWVAVVLVLAGLFFIFIFVRSQPRPPGRGGRPASTEAAPPQLTEAEIAKLPKDFKKLVAMGNNYFDHQQFHDAMVVYRRALELDSSDLNLRVDYGACLNFLGDFAGAKSQLEKALALEPNHPVANFNLGVVYVNLGQNEQAKKYWKKYLELDPGSGRAAEVKKFLSELK